VTRYLPLILALAASSPAADPPPIPREFRGAWVAAVANIDWPSKPGLPTTQQQEELLRILDAAHGLNLNAVVNAVVFQVRAARAAPAATGHIHFGMQAILEQRPGLITPLTDL
jgi:uncharacterized lipoprotein YddW (UPF0748 family)